MVEHGLHRAEETPCVRVHESVRWILLGWGERPVSAARVSPWGPSSDLGRISKRSDAPAKNGETSRRQHQTQSDWITSFEIIPFAEDYTIDEILEAYPYLEREDIRAALRYAAWRAEESEIALEQE